VSYGTTPFARSAFGIRKLQSQRAIMARGRLPAGPAMKVKLNPMAATNTTMAIMQAFAVRGQLEDGNRHARATVPRASSRGREGRSAEHAAAEELNIT